MVPGIRARRSMNSRAGRGAGRPTGRWPGALVGPGNAKAAPGRPRRPPPRNSPASTRPWPKAWHLGAGTAHRVARPNYGVNDSGGSAVLRHNWWLGLLQRRVAQPAVPAGCAHHVRGAGARVVAAHPLAFDWEWLDPHRRHVLGVVWGRSTRTPGDRFLPPSPRKAFAALAGFRGRGSFVMAAGHRRGPSRRMCWRLPRRSAKLELLAQAARRGLPRWTQHDVRGTRNTACRWWSRPIRDDPTRKRLPDHRTRTPACGVKFGRVSAEELREAILAGAGRPELRRRCRAHPGLVRGGRRRRKQPRIRLEGLL